MLDKDSQINTFNENNEKFFDEIPKLSNSEINITTPKNKTYAEPMRGYYPASYGFENDNVGDNPEGWSTTEPSGCGFVEVDASLNGHNKVVEVRKNGGTTRVLIEKQFEQNPTQGTVEYWLYKDTASGTDGTIIYLLGDVGSAYFLIENGNLYRGPYPSRVLIASGIFSANIWHHFRIDFDVSQGYQIYLDDILYGAGYSLPFDGSPSYITGFRLRSHFSGCHPNYGAWLNAFSYSWDDDYNIGDNLEEGLLVSFDLGFSPEWQAYSLDGQVNKTISGNTTISMPNEGRHNIQVFGNNSFGEMFESDIRYFAIKYFPINIITPENKTYTQPMSGFYPATYGFENETEGTSGIDIGFVDIIDSICSVEVVNELDGHLKVLYYNTPIAHRWVRNSFDSNKTSGTVEFWIRLGETNKRHVIYLNDGSGGSISLSWFEDGYVKFDNRTNAGDIEIIEPYNALQWYHVRIEFDVATDWHLWIDGVSKDGGSGYGYVNTPSDFTTFIFGGLEDNNFWLDAVGYSWDPKYNIKDNKNEGLLLSYTNRTSLTWIGYSLDGQPNKTVSGNTVIPLFSNGNHNIRLYGRNSTGIIFESPVRYYSIDIPAPQIFIISPQNGDNFGLSAPDFSISISTPILDTTWYTMDNGTTKIIFTGLSGTINQIEWDKFGFESVTIQFYINDTFGQESYSQVTIDKDPYPPTPPDDVLIIIIISMVVGIIIIDLIAIGLIYIRKKKTFVGEKKPKVKKVIKEKPTGKIIISREEITTYQQFKVCPFCKYELKVGYTFCIHCGSKLK